LRAPERKGINTEGTESTEDAEKRRKAAASCRIPKHRLEASATKYKGKTAT
jgi:hypothetical protein